MPKRMSSASMVFKRDTSGNLCTKTATIRSSIICGFEFHFNWVAINKNVEWDLNLS